MGSSADGNKDPISKSPTDLCHELQADGAKTHHFVSVSAENSAGVSRPSNITIPDMSTGEERRWTLVVLWIYWIISQQGCDFITFVFPTGAGVETSDIKGNNGTFDLVWERSPRFTCGYVVDWYPTYKAQQCGVKWEKFPSDDNDKIPSGQ